MHFSNDPFDRHALPSAHCNAGGGSPLQPPDIASLCSSASRHEPHYGSTCPTAAATGSREVYPSVCLKWQTCLKRPRCDLVCVHPSQSCPQSHMSVPPKWGTHPVRSAPTGKRSSTALAGTHNPVGADPRAGTGPFPTPRALVLPMVKLGQTKPDGLGHIDTSDSDLMHHQYRLSVLQWNPGPARRNPTIFVAAACGRFHAVILQEAIDHVPHISDQFIAHTGNTDLAILLHKDTFEPDPTVLAFKEDSTS